MSEQKALFLDRAGGDFELRFKEIQKPKPDEILVKAMAVGLNPVDWMLHKVRPQFIKNFPVIFGEDCAGLVHEVGENVTTFKKGDRVVLQGAFDSNDRGCFQQYVANLAELCAKLPENISFDDAASIPLGLATAVEGLYGNGVNRVADGIRKLTPPWADGGANAYKDEPIVIFSGASSVGQFAIQLAKLSGFSPIIATASLKNADLLKSLGATHVVDRNADVVAEVRKMNEGGKPIEVVFDIPSTMETQTQSFEIAAPGGQVIAGTMVRVNKADYPDKHLVVFFASFHEPALRPLGADLYRHLTHLLQTRALKPVPVEVHPGGLAGIVPAFQKRDEVGVSGVKAIVRPTETP